MIRHYWIVFKLLLSTLATIVLLLKMEPITYLAHAATATSFSSGDLIELRASLLLHAIGGLLVLLCATVLAVYKPTGMTGYGMHQQRVAGSVIERSDPPVPTSTPRWVKTVGMLVIVLMLLVGLMMVVGGHGPGAHLRAVGSTDMPAEFAVADTAAAI